MAEITLVAETGRAPGSPESRRLRREGKIPAVVYGHGIDPLPVAVDGRELRHALTGESGLNALVNLKVEGATHLTMARVLQRHPVRGTVTHVDFQVVSRDEVVHADVPIHIVGEPKAVLSEGGVVDHSLTTLAVLATPALIPHVIEVDVTNLRVGDAIRVGDLTLPAGVVTEVDPDEAIVVAQGQQVSELDLIPEADADALKELADAQAATAEEGGGTAAEGGSGGGSGGDSGEGGGSAD
jgi:large subunit ribosomal protein L25